MKRFFQLTPALLAAALVFTACEDDSTNNENNSTDNSGAYVINYGGYSQENASITRYDVEESKTTNFYYEEQNGEKIGGPVQWAYNYDSKVYLTGNNPDYVLVTDESFTAIDTISENVAKPRTCIADGNYLYISCLGESPDWGTMPDTYILKYNLETKTSEKIACPGGPEGLEIANGKLYIALNYATQIAVMDLNSEEISHIEVGAASTYFAKDASNNLYVTLLSTYSMPAVTEGIAYINTSTNALTIYELSGVSGNYAKTIDISKDGSEVYVLAATYDDEYNLVGGVSVFDTTNNAFKETPVVSNITGINGLTVNPDNGDLYIFKSNGTVDNGEMFIYRNGEKVGTQNVGAAPIMAIFID
ncbi:MAG: hypothetical protein ACK5JS_00270 [Mangrovibacterium sp.]